jgi:hypothetical protein
MTAYEEIRSTGKAGREVTKMLIALVAQVTRTSTFPAPAGHERWSEQAVMDHVAALFTRKKGVGFLIAAALKADGQKSLEWQLLTYIRNDLIDEAKATPVGKLRRRLRTLLGKDERFDDAKHLFRGDEAWMLVTGAQQPWAGTPEDLADATSDVVVADMESLPKAGPTPKSARESLLTLSHEALHRLDAAVRAQTLARFLARRFGLDRMTETTGHDGARDAVWDDPEINGDDDRSELADAVYDSLTDEERWLVATLHDEDAIRERRGREGIDAAEVLKDRLRAFAGTDDGRAAVGAVARRCEKEQTS